MGLIFLVLGAGVEDVILLDGPLTAALGVIFLAGVDATLVPFVLALAFSEDFAARLSRSTSESGLLKHK